MKKLVIAEKPSVARDLAAALGKVAKKGEWYENDEWVISSAVGHLVELFMPDDIDKKLKAWSLKTLPIIPDQFQLKPIEKTKGKFQELQKLLKRKDIDLVINACDAGREGELIFAYIYELSKSKLPVKRLWMVSMTPSGIKRAFEDLRTAEQMQPLQNAARCRSESDWLVGINGTRALTKRMFGIQNVAPVGRVQTPTLTMVVDREKAIRAFQPRTYWRIKGLFKIAEGEYEGVYQRPDFRKSDDAHDRADRLWEKPAAEAIREAVATKTAQVSDEKKRTRQAAGRLYDLTTLQREANGRYGFPAGKTLRVAQSLYEKHKVLTYPRTDSKALPEDYGQTVRDVLRAFQGPLAAHAQKVLANDWVKPGNKRVFNNAEVSDHFAIIPTGTFKATLTEDESKIFDMVCRRFISIFFPPAEFDVTTRLSTIGEHTFKTEGKVLVVPGWLEVQGKGVSEADLPALTDADGKPPQAKLASVDTEEDATRPPPRFNEATLLAAMETAGKLVEDEEHAEAMKESGLGTPATRAATIDHLINEKYMLREGRELAPTPKAEELIEFLRTIGVDVLTSPAMTGDWEHRLRLMEQGRLSREEFMQGIKNITSDLVEKTRAFEEKEEELPETNFISPTDNKPMREAMRFYRSQDGALTIYKNMGNRALQAEEIETLLREGKVGPIDGFRSKAGKPFSAMLVLQDNKAKFDFGGGENGDDEAADLSQYPVIATCPLDGGAVHATPTAYVCANYKRGDEGCSFRVGRIILGRAIAPEEFQQLIEQKKTGVLKGFRSNRTKRLFDAFLVLKDNGGVGFEFPPREPRAPKAGKGRKTPAKAKKEPASTDKEPF
jgi:DNA topoisomerase III